MEEPAADPPEPDASDPRASRSGASESGASGGPGSRPGAPAGRVETLAAALVALLLAAIPLWPGLVAGGDAVTMAVDTATVAEPWNTVLEAAGAPAGRPRNPELSDQGVVFYPGYRWVVESWLAGDPPLWCPLIYCGAPGLGNPQFGVLDPQVGALVAAEALGGRRAFHATLDALGWLRLAGAGLGAFLLARVLGLGRAGAALAGLGFGLSGFGVLWLHHSLGHVTPWLPWVLLGLEGTRGPRPGRSAVGAGAALALAVLGGHPETAFYVGAAAGLWALAILAEDRRAGLLGLTGLLLGSLVTAPATLPFLEYLGRSAAQEVRAASAEREALRVAGLVALGAVVGGLALVRRGRGPRLVVGAAAALGGVLLWRAAGLPPTAGLTFVADLFGRPGDGRGGWTGQGSYIEEASGWLPAAVLMLAAAAALGRPRDGGGLRRRALVLWAGFLALALVVRAPGLLELKRLLPVVGLGATVRLAVVSSLFLSLAAGAALERASRAARAGGVLAFAALALATAWPEHVPAPPGELARGPESDGALTFVLRPEPVLDGTRAELEGWIAAEVPVDRVRIRVAPVGVDGELDLARRRDLPAELQLAPSPAALARADVGAAPAGARWFRSGYLQVGRLDVGTWAFDVELFAPGAAEPLAVRRAAVSEVRRDPRPTAASWALLALTGLAVALAGGRPGRFAVVALAGAHGLWFARGVNPAVPAAELFPSTATERLVAREQGFHRFFADPRTLVPDTGLVRSLRALDGYDGMDPADYNAFRLLALRPGANALLAWNPRGVDLDAPAWDLLGVGLLVLRGPLEHPDWELVAGPGPGHPEPAETWIYAARERPPRAFVATEAATPDEVAELADWDPTRTVATLADWRPRTPAARTRAEVVAWGNNAVSVEAELDGDGFLVLTEQVFPGWTATVDGQRVPIERANGIFRGVPLTAGTHRVEFRYLPPGALPGSVIAASVLIAAIGLWRVRP